MAGGPSAGRNRSALYLLIVHLMVNVRGHLNIVIVGDRKHMLKLNKLLTQRQYIQYNIDLLMLIHCMRYLISLTDFFYF